MTTGRLRPRAHNGATLARELTAQDSKLFINGEELAKKSDISARAYASGTLSDEITTPEYMDANQDSEEITKSGFDFVEAGLQKMFSFAQNRTASFLVTVNLLVEKTTSGAGNLTAAIRAYDYSGMSTEYPASEVITVFGDDEGFERIAVTAIVELEKNCKISVIAKRPQQDFVISGTIIITEI